MGLRCLLGHDFGEPELRREREEDGNEVVTTVSEVKTCARCGETQVVSENTEVTTMEQLTDEATTARTGSTGASDAPADATAGAAGSSAAVEPAETDGLTADSSSQDETSDAAVGTAAAETDGDDAVIIGDAPEAAEDDARDTAADEGAEASGESDDRSDAGDEQPDPTATPEDEGAELLEAGPSDAEGDDGGLGGGEAYTEYPEAETTEAPTGDEERAETDDGIILDETAEAGDDRERGAWPAVDEDETPGAEPTPWPEQEGADEGFSAEVGNGDGSGGVEFGGGLTPEAANPEELGDDAEYVEAPDRDPVGATGADGSDDGWAAGDAGETAADEGIGITRGESPDLEPSTSDVTMEYYCPECEMTRDADGNSMRAGDICPECKRGYVTERPI
ncbi:hypothetical protein C461_13331 [Halorubrum aidingense JCM 13560]|uniref:Uncharacterized protein n=1 Tax=Halorubrum aidingense JCM 13560 TaxID=1230454 RepID=M0PA35_9EURY|nr:hypothetical protein [Halorubrum aidingense]EMA65685.1 hypothetical protein C461_13331 [Halorubrum aidingense JCM 13560]